MEDVAVFWDYENCPVPFNISGYSVVNNICALALAYGTVKSLKAYLGIAEQTSVPRAVALRSELQSSGVSLVDCPHNGRKDVADKMIIVDMLAHAIDNPAPSTVMVITGDRDFAYAISILKLRRYRVVLVTLNNAHPSLTSQASLYFDWNTEILDPVAPSGKATKVGLPATGTNKLFLDKNPTTPFSTDKSQDAVPGNTLAKDDIDAQRKFQPSPHIPTLASAESASYKEVVNPTQLIQPKPATQLREAPVEAAHSEQEGHDPSISREDIEDLIQNIQRLSSLRRIQNVTLSTPHYNPPASQKNESPPTVTRPSTPNVNQKPPLVVETSHTQPVNSGSSSNIDTRHRSDSVLSQIPAPPSPNAAIVPPMQPNFHTHPGTAFPESILQRPSSAPGLIPLSIDLPVKLPPPATNIIPTNHPRVISPLMMTNNPVPTITTNLNPSITVVPPNKPSPNSNPGNLPASESPITPHNRIMLGVIPSSSHNLILSPPASSTKDWASPISIPDEFNILVKALLRYKSKGNLRPLRSALAGDVSRNDTFKKAGVEKFRDYIRLAQQRGLIDVGGQEKQSWIALKPKFHDVTL